MRYLRVSLVLMLCLSMLIPVGCSSFQNMNKTGQNAIVGGAAGGAVGAGIGALIGGGKGTWIGALIGTAVGAGAGAAIGNQMDKQRAELERELDGIRAEQDAIKVQQVKDSNNLDAIKVVMSGGILFNTGSARLNPEANAALSRIAFNLKQNPNTLITVVGYTDNTGSYERNMQLSKERAESVVSYLMGQGVSASRLKAVGDGWNNPVASNDTAEGRAQNRRVEIFITADEQMIQDAQ